MPPTEEVLEERIIALRQATEGGFTRIEKMLDRMTRDMVTTKHCNAWCERVVSNHGRLASHDLRLASLERVTWLLGIIGTLALVIIAALLVAWATGNMTILWK